MTSVPGVVRILRALLLVQMWTLLQLVSHPMAPFRGCKRKNPFRDCLFEEKGLLE